MVLEHIGMPQPGDCRVVFSASAEELEAAIQAEQTAENPPQAEEDLLTAAVNRAILTGFSTLYQELVEKEHLVPVTDPDFELLAVNRAEGFRAGAEFYCLPPLELERYTGFTQLQRRRPGQHKGTGYPEIGKAQVLQIVSPLPERESTRVFSKLHVDDAA